MSIEDDLGKIRPHTSSQLPHQKVPAQLLVAMEDSFEERTPTAYFAATLSCLQTQLTSHGEQGLEEGDRLPAVLYLLGLILPHVSPPVVRTNLSTTMNALTSLYPSLNQHAPALRSALSITGALLRALDRNLLVETHGVKKLFSTLLDFVADGRPKVRKKAAEEIRMILETPLSPLQVHPYAGGVLKWTTSKLVAGEENTIHVVVFLRGILSSLHLDGQPLSEVDELPPQLLSLTKLHNPHLEAAVYGLLSDLLSMSTSSNRATVTTLLNNVPSSIDPQLCSAWSSIFASITLPQLEPGSSSSTTEFLRIFQTLFGFLSSQNANLQRIASESLSGFLQGNFGSQADLSTSEGNACVETILQQLSQALVALPYAHALPYTLNVLASVLSSFPHKLAKRKSKDKTGDDTFQLVAPLITSVSKLRISPKFIHKESADRVFVGVYLRWGAQRLLDLVPMNIEPSDRKGKSPEAHAYLLPLLAAPASAPHPTPLGHFIEYFVPLSERMFEYKTTAEGSSGDKGAAEVKMWNVLIGQVWACFAGFVDYRSEKGGRKGRRSVIVEEKGLLADSWTPAFSQLLSTLLYTPPPDSKELRGYVLKGLRVAVESILSGISQNEDAEEENSIDTLDDAKSSIESPAAQQIRQKNRAFLASQAESWFGVLFNLFTSAAVSKDERGPVVDVIRVWCGVSSPSILEKTLEKMISMLNQHLPRAGTERQGHGRGGQLVPNEAASIVQRMEDLILIFLPSLSSASRGKVWDFFLGNQTAKAEKKDALHCDEVGVRKRAWRILGRCLELEEEAGQKELDEGIVTSVVKIEETGGAKRDRLSFLLQLIPHIPRTSLHLIPTLIPEVVLTTKEPAERSRKVAFDVIIRMAEKMEEGGTVRRGLVDDAEGEDEMGEEVEASLEEYMVMVGAGLAGATPHMVSATVMAISRLVFEFQDKIKPEMHSEILTTLIQFLTSTNREIIKSTLGFIKLAIHTLPQPLLVPHLDTLVPNLLTWAKDYKNHFKVRVQHIFERMMRVFGAQAVIDAVKGGDEEGVKVLEAVRKRKERAKRKKRAAKEREEEEVEETTAPRASRSSKKGEEFDDVLYGSESESGSEDDEVEETVPQKRRGGKVTKGQGNKLRGDDDEPMDLLEGVGMRIEGAARPRRKPGQDASRFKTESWSGKMIIADPDDSSDDEAAPISRSRARNAAMGAGAGSKGEMDVAGTAYIESMVSTDGFTRGPGGRVKFHKDTKKRRRAEAEFDDGMGMDVDEPAKTAPPPMHKKMKGKEKKLGHEFKAKKAGGDVKKGGLDPYAYVPLGQAAKHQKGGKGRIGIASRR